MAKRAFDHCATDYDRYRPGYPDELVAWVARSAPDGIIADVGAGSGIFTCALRAKGRSVVAIDPSLAMLGHIVARDGLVPIHRVAANAEQTPLAAASVPAVTCAQSFHWFNPPFALAEFARILHPDGLLLLAWNDRDRRNPFVAALDALVTEFNPAFRSEYRRQDWTAKIAESGRYSPAEQMRFERLWRLPQKDVVGYTRSISYIRNVLSAEARLRFEAELADLLHRHFGDEDCCIPLTTHVWWCRRCD